MKFENKKLMEQWGSAVVLHLFIKKPPIQKKTFIFSAKKHHSNRPIQVKQVFHYKLNQLLK